MERVILGTIVLVCLLASIGCAAPRGGPPETALNLPAASPHPATQAPPTAVVRRRPTRARHDTVSTFVDLDRPRPPREERTPRDVGARETPGAIDSRVPEAVR